MKAFVAVIGALALLGYPFAVYFGLSRLSPRHVALLVVAAVAVLTLANLAGKPSAGLWHVVRLPLAVAAVAGLGAVFDDPTFVLALPVLTNLVLLAEFAGTLAGPLPLVERFARLQHPDLTAAEQRYCRTVTVTWSAFFVVNAAASAALAVLAPLRFWTLYTGVLAYVLMGALFTVEYLYRKFRFRRFGPRLHDRVLERMAKVLGGRTEVRQ